MFQVTDNKDNIEIVIVKDNYENTYCKNNIYQYLHHILFYFIFLTLFTYYIVLNFVY